MDGLRAGLDAPTPGPLLGLVGMLLSVAASDDDPATALASIVRALSDADREEASAALLAVATMTVEPELRRRVRRELAERGHVLPRWLADLHRAEPVDRAVEVSTVFRDTDELYVSVSVPGGHVLTAMVLVHNEIGAVAVDASVVELPLEEVLALVTEDDDPDLRVRDVRPADAAARVHGALAALDSWPHDGLGSPTLVESRGLIEWMVSLLPEGGRDDVLQELSDDELDLLAEGFLTSPFGTPWSDAGLRPLVDEVLAAGSSNGIGDPLVWSTHNVEAVLDPDGRHFGRRTPGAERAPDVLRDLIRYGHTERGLRTALTDQALTAIDAGADAFRRAVAAPGGR
ncbi:hypothetical protein [Blastococcus sp. URHD0036]|uniref:hypothetical protein n=1 Tax=Blastococcus sp. URHD0036 TaxID=1380356 RepID=UPI00068DD28D|nr:hypothetical protein [Blastococcus sp. URHD0036]